MTFLTRLVRYTTWANQTWMDAIETLAPEDSYLLRTMSHLLLAEKVWLQRIGGEEIDAEIWKTLSFVDMQTLHARHTERYGALLRDDLDRVVSYRRFTGEQHQSSIADILLHLVTHGAHHRGQMATYASGIGLTPPKADYIHFSAAGKA